MTSDLHTRFHETWLGMVQPVEGLVVSVPVLVESQCMERRGPEAHEAFRELCPLRDAETGLALDERKAARTKRGRDELERKRREGRRQYRELTAFLEDLLGWTPDLYDQGDALPENLSRYIAEGPQTIRPTLALRRLGSAGEAVPTGGVPDVATPESEAGKPYLALVWELPAGLAFDKPETQTGDWRYPPAAKFDRLLRACRVPIGLLSNQEAIRLVYAPHGEATGSITFDFTEMGETGGRPILDAFTTLLSAHRLFGVREDDALPALLKRSRERQANVTNELAAQVFDALDILLRGFEAAAQRDSHANLQALVELSKGHDPSTHLTEDDHLYGGLLTVLLRLVFLLYAEDKELLPTDNEAYLKSLSLAQLFEDLQRDHGTFPDTMNRRFGAWPRLLALFRTVYHGVEHGSFYIPPRRGELFDPVRYPFLESWGLPHDAAANTPVDMAELRVPTVDDETIYRILAKLVILEGQRLSYKVLDVEQIGSVYEALMGYGVISLDSPGICCRHKSLQSGSSGGVWIEAGEVLAQKPASRGKFLTERYDVVKGDANKIAKELKAAKTEAEVLGALDRISLKKVDRRGPGQLALQPGEERRRTSSHYTPRSLTEPIVRKTLEPLLATMSDEAKPSSEKLLSLKICDPAMGSGAFLVEACRFIADHVVAAWEREGQMDKIASAKEDVVTHARRLVAQKCLYGVDKNPFAVSLAKLSLWLFTLSKEEPFTFVDHCLRHGDSLVGLSYQQIKAFHWHPQAQKDFLDDELESCIDESLALRQQILDLAGDPRPPVWRLKERLLWDSVDAQKRARIIGDLIVGAFLEYSKAKDREAERLRRLDLVRQWLAQSGEPPAEILEMSARIRQRLPVFHWHLELPEVFHEERPDPLDGDKTEDALMDAFLGNPPFLGGTGFNRRLGDEYCAWLRESTEAASGNADLCAYFFRRTSHLLGSTGTIGLIATNTIAQGDTRSSALKHLLSTGHEIFSATTSLPWPGQANIVVSIVHLAKGRLPPLQRTLNGKTVDALNSRLRAKAERPDPVPLEANQDLCFKGVDVYGIGFALSIEEASDLIAADSRCAEAIRPYIGGRELNSSPTQSYERMVIDFGEKTLDECARYPSALELVRERVRPVRDAVRGKSGAAQKLKTYWWRFGRRTPTLDAALSELETCLVCAQVTKHLCFTFQPTDRVFSQKVWVIPREDYAFFAVMQSRLHETWAWLLSATMKTDLSYCASDCFDNFPFPSPSTVTATSRLERAGRDFYEQRARLMLQRDQGLTTTYNQLKDPWVSDPEIKELRQLQLEMDRAVLSAYGWSDVEPPSFTEPVNDREREAKASFEDEIIDRLFILNAKRAEEERALGDTNSKTSRTPKRTIRKRRSLPAHEQAASSSTGKR